MKVLVSLTFFFFSYGLFAGEIPSSVFDSFVKTKTTYFDQKTKKYEDIYGTGTIVNYQSVSYLITASHVVAGDKTIFYDSAGKEIKITQTLEIENYWDYAVFKIKGNYSSLFEFNSSKQKIEAHLPRELCFIPNLYPQKDEKNILLLSAKDIVQSSTWNESILNSVAIKPKMSGSPLICKSELVGILKAFNRIHDISYATQSFLSIYGNIQKDELGTEKSNPFFISAKWYLFNHELLRKFISESKDSYMEIPNNLSISMRKNAGGGVRSDGGGGVRSDGGGTLLIEDLNKVDKTTNIYLNKFGFFDNKQRQIYAFSADSLDSYQQRKMYFLANESSLVFVKGFDYGMTMYESLTDLKEIDNTVDLLEVLKDRSRVRIIGRIF